MNSHSLFSYFKSNRQTILCVLQLFFWTLLSFDTSIKKGGTNAYPYLATLATIAMIISLVLMNLSLIESICYLFLFIFGSMILYHSRYREFLMLLLMVLAIRGLNESLLWKCVLIVRLVAFFGQLFLFALGVLPDNIYEEGSLINREIRIKHSLGFFNSQTAHLDFFIILLLVLYIFYQKLPRIIYLLLFAANYALYHFTCCRSAFMLITAIILFFAIYSFISSDSVLRILNIIFSFACAIPILVSFYDAIFWNPTTSYGQLAYRIFNTRPKWTYLYFHSYRSLAPLGQQFWLPLDWVLDNGIIFTYLKGGYLLFGVLVISYGLILIKSVHDGAWHRILFIFAFLCYGYTEDFFITPAVNYSLVFIGYLFWDIVNMIRSSIEEKGL